ncbi:MAG: xylulokinase [Bacteroidota bacterium]
MASSVFLGLDLGTSGVRCLAIDASGALVAETHATYPLLTPQAGWTEQRPQDWHEQTFAALRALVGKLDGHRIEALGLSGQMHGMVAISADGQPIRPALLWNDGRTGAQVDAIEAAIGRPELIQRTGNRGATGFQLPKVLWLRDEEPEAFALTQLVLFPKDYIGYLLTGEAVAEPSDGSGSGAFNLAQKTWDTDLLSELDLRTDLFPRVIPSDGVVGHVTAEAAGATGLPQGTPVIAGAGDNAAAATGLGISNARPHTGSMSLGTSGVIFMPLAAPKPDPEGRVHLFCHADGNYHLLGVTLSAAGSLQWFHDTLAPNTPFADLVDEAATSAPGSNGVTFRPYLAGERTPHMNPDLRGSWTGLSLASNRADMVRALLEGVAFSLRDALDLIHDLSQPHELLATGGGSKSPFWLQLTSDVLGLPLGRPAVNQGAAYGAALLAMQGTGAVASTLDVVDRTLTSRVESNPEADYEAARQRYLG